MKEFEGKVAVVTGSASGIGLSIASRLLKENMKVVFSDINENSLFDLINHSYPNNDSILAVKCDVSKSEDVRNLADKALEKFGGIHLVINNAGLGTTHDYLKPLWSTRDSDWEKIMSVNLWGVINGIRTFIPIMIERGDEGYMVNIASMAGLGGGDGNGIYSMTKSAVVNLSETLWFQLENMDSKIGVSVLCPGLVKTNITESTKGYQSDPMLNNDEKDMISSLIEAVDSGISPDLVSEMILEGIINKKLHIITHTWARDQINQRMENILSGISTLAV